MSTIMKLTIARRHYMEISLPNFALIDQERWKRLVNFTYALTLSITCDRADVHETRSCSASFCNKSSNEYLKPTDCLVADTRSQTDGQT